MFQKEIVLFTKIVRAVTNKSAEPTVSTINDPKNRIFCIFLRGKMLYLSELQTFRVYIHTCIQLNIIFKLFNVSVHFFPC